ncbi:MAG: sporulation protein YqfD [Firmicutes bacterium]|nr:sporulation protein YqfD [Bacillota bacterium]
MFNRLKLLLFGQVYFVASGVNFDKFLKEVLKGSITLYNVKRALSVKEGRAVNKVYFSVDFLNYKKLVAIAENLCYNIEVLKGAGFLYSFSKPRFRTSFVAGLFLCLIVVFAFNAFIWRVEVNGLHTLYEADVRAVLRDSGARVGGARRLNTRELENDILKGLDGVAAVSVVVRGVSLVVNIDEVVRPDFDFGCSNVVSDGVNLIANADAIITNIVVLRGIQMVQIGDVVEVGTILIAGSDEVRATGYVYARVFLQHTISVPDTEIVLRRTGRYEIYSTFRLHNLTFFGSKAGKTSFENYEKTTNEFYAFKSFIPLRRVTHTFFELESVTITNDFEALKEQTIIKARSSINVPKGAVVTNEQVSITQALGINSVTVTLEFETRIGV